MQNRADYFPNDVMKAFKLLSNALQLNQEILPLALHQIHSDPSTDSTIMSKIGGSKCRIISIGTKKDIDKLMTAFIRLKCKVQHTGCPNLI